MSWLIAPVVAIGTLVVLRIAWPGFFASGGGLFIAGGVAFLSGTGVSALANPNAVRRSAATAGASVLIVLAAYIAMMQSMLPPDAVQGGANVPGSPVGDAAGRRPARGGGSGGGPLSPSVVYTWQGHFENGAAPRSPTGAPPPASLDLLVLWRGQPGFDQALISTTVGESGSAHRVQFRGQPLELRFDRQADTVHLGDHVVRLAGANVVLVDNADDPQRLVVAGTIVVDPLNASDPMQVIRRLPRLFEYLRCDPRSAGCAQLR